DIKTIMDKMKDQAYLINSSSGSFSHLRLNPKRPPFDNVKMRQAVLLALDRQQIIDASRPGGAEVTGLVPPGLAGDGAYTVDELSRMPGYRYPKDQDIAEAKKLVKEAGLEGV